ncbi:ATP-binding cassette transporter CGR1 [Zalaria obscura]|uniref:ATP-binding cassette transporter CGR1 n=1 Tax=Zalaria obscura TaxID=2024903 RepID=A0ACC3S933_9PEZI
MGERARQKTAIVVGAGAGGVSTAARLAKAGFAVTVLEKNDFTGGRCSLLHHEGWRFDQGPSLLLLPRLFHQTFTELGTSLHAEGVTLLKCDPNYNIWFGDGTSFRLSTDLASMKAEIEAWEGKDGFSRYLSFLRESHAHYELSVTHVLLRNFTSLASMLRPSFLRHLVALHPFESIWGRAGRYFRTERLRRVFTFGSMYMGMSPFDAPGTYSLLQYTELAEGIWYPVGGFHRMIEALVNVGKRLGVEYRLSTPISRILLSADGKRALGVELPSGEHLYADVVINNTDLVYAYNSLLPRTPYAESLSQRPASCSSISFYWALDRQFPELEAHNIFLADEYRESFDSIFKKHLIPNEPSFYVNVPSRVDATAAPEGKDSIVVLVPVGHLLDADTPRTGDPTADSAASANGSTQKHASTPTPTSSSSSGGILPTTNQDWPAMIDLARRTILSTIASRTGADLAPHIVHELTNTPLSWRSSFNLSKGAILGLSHSFFNVLSFRPSTRARRGGILDGRFGGGVLRRVAEVLWTGGRVQGLYMVGASAHPGTGVPIVLAGGRLVAEQVCGDLGVAVPWKDEVEVEPKGELDRVQRAPVMEWVHWVLVAAVTPWVIVLFWAFVVMLVLRW